MDGDGLVRRQGPRRGCPDDKECSGAWIERKKPLRVRDRKFDVNRRRGVILVFDFGFSQRRNARRAPVDGFLLPIERTGGGNLPELANLLGLVGGIQGQIGMVPITKNTQSFEFFAL